MKLEVEEVEAAGGGWGDDDIIIDEGKSSLAGC